MTRITGPARVRHPGGVRENWVYCTGEVLAGDPLLPADSRPSAGPCSVSVASSPSEAQQPIRLLFWLSFAGARRRLWICNSYFIPDLRLREAVVERARQGVDVRILVPGNHTDAVPVQLAGRSYYEELLAAGVRIFEYHAGDDARQDRRGGRRLERGRLGQHGRAQHGAQRGEHRRHRRREPSPARSRRASSGTSPGRARCKLEEWRRRPIWQRGLEQLAKVLIEQY